MHKFDWGIVKALSFSHLCRTGSCKLLDDRTKEINWYRVEPETEETPFALLTRSHASTFGKVLK